MATRPRLDTIGKNHIQGSFIFCIELLSLSALNLILSLRIITRILPKVIFLLHRLQVTFPDSCKMPQNDIIYF